MKSTTGSSKRRIISRLVKGANGRMRYCAMRFAEELADVSEFALPNTHSVRPQELEMAKSLVEALASPWKPEQYKDEYQANIMRVIQAKLKGKQPKLQGETVGPQQAEVVDLMARLRQSLEAGVRPREKQ